MAKEYTLPKLPVKKELESKKVLKKVVSSNRALAELKGVAETIPNQSILINALALQEAKDSSEIENIVTTHDELYRASVSSTNISNQAKEVQRYKDALYKGFALIKEHKLLLKKHIVEIQKVLENNDAGIRTQSGTSLINDKTGEIIYMPPQNYEDIQNLMANLEQYINTPFLDEHDPLTKMAIIHYQFESIHPFYDGNGRTGRIINILFLILNNLLDLPILYLSSYIIANKNDYYRLLNEVRTKNNWEEWILYILDGVEVTAKNTINIIKEINSLMKITKAQLSENLPKMYSKDLLELLFMHPYTKINFLVDELDVTRKTAGVYLREIEKLGILESIRVGREVYFINKKLFEILKTKY
ncbi:Fic family protein [Arcobacter arenosus]|uniref:Fic family protein n=1 Tax=Arcobacter arenosus TaxID=2576037 RepID=A0A5R8XYF7_9BACT|nr:Fic/DOC family N-terminal domain-containing protein [Arcobacter arenosus]TLP36812.1 Fic family protein [Arcobacter arenosus]